MLGTATDDIYFEFWTNYAVKSNCLLKMALKVIFFLLVNNLKSAKLW